MQTCLTCGRLGSVELHHPAGRHNVPEYVVPVCAECHLILTNWQQCAGIEMRAEHSRGPVDVNRATCVGSVHLLQLVARRTGDPHLEALWPIMSRAMSRVLDLDADPARAGRWLPDSVIEPHPVDPVVIDAHREQAQLRELAHLVGALLRLLGEIPPLTQEVWNQVTLNLDSMPRRLAAIDAQDHAGPSLAILIDQHVEDTRRLVQWLVSVDDWERVDERDLNEARVWLSTGERILAKVARAALSDGDAV